MLGIVGDSMIIDGVVISNGVMSAPLDNGVLYDMSGEAKTLIVRNV